MGQAASLKPHKGCNGHHFERASAERGKGGKSDSKAGDPMSPFACIVSCSIHSAVVSPKVLNSPLSPDTTVLQDIHSILAFIPTAPVEDIFHPPA